jgi:hypothetical protein
MYQGTLCSALVLAALRAAPRPSRQADRHQTRTEVETPQTGSPDTRPQISNDQDQLQEEENRQLLGLPSAWARPFPAGCPPLPSMTEYRPIGLTLSDWPPDDRLRRGIQARPERCHRHVDILIT